MAIVGDICAPVLTGKSAQRFKRMMERVDSMPERELPEDFYLEFEKSLEKSRLYAQRHKSNLKKAGKNEGKELQSGK